MTVAGRTTVPDNERIRQLLAAKLHFALPRSCGPQNVSVMQFISPIHGLALIVLVLGATMLHSDGSSFDRSYVCDSHLFSSCYGCVDLPTRFVGFIGSGIIGRG